MTENFAKILQWSTAAANSPILDLIEFLDSPSEVLERKLRDKFLVELKGCNFTET